MSLPRESALVFKRMVREGNRQAPIAYVFPLMMTAVGLALFSQLLKRMADLPAFPAKSYADWLVAGGVLLPGMMGAGFTAVSLANDIESGYFERLRLVAARPAAHVLGRLLFEGLRIVPAAVVILLAARLQGAHIESGPLGFAALVAFSAVWAMAYNGLFLAVALKAGSAQGPQGLLPLFGPLSFVSSLWIPVKYMPSWARRIAEVNPLTRAIDFSRSFTTNHYEAGTLLIGAAAVAALFVFAQVLVARNLSMRLAGE
ncbi:MAG TPA: ABC transporter permease [Acidimicrobiales bacterium]|nr:ABC transporter permease [Acidimicrobiales bacterium]